MPNFLKPKVIDVESPARDDADLRRRLAAHVKRYAPVWLRADVDDITQAAWIRLDASGKKNARNRVPGTSLIKRVAFCATMDEIRRRRRRPEAQPSSKLEELKAGSQNPARAAQVAELRRALRECQEIMIDNRRLAVTLYLQGHTAPDAGRLLGWSTAKTESLIFRGLADLRRCLSGKGHTP